MRTLIKLALAPILVVASIAGPATPASATSLVEITSGIITTVLGDVDLTPGSQGVDPCPAKPDTWRFTSTANPDRWTLNGTFSRQFQLPPNSGNWYQIDRTALMGSGGAWTGAAPAHALTGTIVIQTRIYQLQLAGGPLTCTKTNRRCIITTAPMLASTSTYKVTPGAPGLPTTTTGDRVTVDASGTMVVSSCSPPWSVVGGTTVSFTDLQLTVL